MDEEVNQDKNGDVPYTDVYNTRPRRKFTAYSLGGPCAPSYCTRPPNVKNYGFVHRLTVFCELIVTHSRYRSIAHVQNVQYTVGSWGARTGGHGVTRVDSDHAECCCSILVLPNTVTCKVSILCNQIQVYSLIRNIRCCCCSVTKSCSGPN